MRPAQTGSLPSYRRELVLVIALAVLAGVRVFLGAAALPLFTTVDEQAHYDLVYKFAAGHWPGAGTDYFAADTARLIALHGSPEYLLPGKVLAVQHPKPLWIAPAPVREPIVQRTAAGWTGRPNHEAHSPPVYYLLAGAWYDLGRVAGLREGFLIYWIRCLNVLLYPPVVVLSYFFVRRFYPGPPFLRLSVPVLLAVLPQDIFFSINSDVASPLLFLGALFFMLEWRDRELPSLGLGVAAGLLAALTFLVKFSNVAILVVLALVLADKARRLARAGQLGRRAGEVLLTAAAAAGPVLAWLGRNAVVLGNASGNADKVASLGWTYKPLGQLANHPFCTPAGFSYFWDGLIRTFWRGEIIWHGEQIAPALCDWFFVGCSIVLIPAAAVRWWLRRRDSAAGRVDAPRGRRLRSVPGGSFPPVRFRRL